MVAWQQREIALPAGVGPEVSCDPASGGTRGQYQGGEYRLMDTQQAVAEGTHTDGQSESKRDGQQKFTLGPNGVLEGKLTARDKLTLGKAAKLNGDVQARRLQIEDGASLNGYVRMGDFEQQGS